jgi:chromatin segregation and condensation protein Rec8/ScpA/Scc1 (kleisin family)
MEEHRVEMMAEQPWEETLDFLTADMPPQEIDIKVLANRYREYIKEMQEYDLSVPAKAIRVCAALLNMKAMAIYSEEEDEKMDEEQNPMDFEEDIETEVEEEDEVDIDMGPELDIPVKNKPKRRMRLGELKEALNDALEVQEQREERQEMRAEMDEAFEVDEDDITDKLNSLMNKITSFTSSDDEKIHFDNLMEQREREEKIEKFKHVLHLENDEKVRLIQEEFLGDLHVRPEDHEVEN